MKGGMQRTKDELTEKNREMAATANLVARDGAAKAHRGSPQRKPKTLTKEGD
jgi:hypothetical protein